MHVTKQRVNNIYEEAFCKQCGRPLDKGDILIEVDNYTSVYCSQHCFVRGEHVALTKDYSNIILNLLEQIPYQT